MALSDVCCIRKSKTISLMWELSHITEQQLTASTDIHGYDKSTP
jgi:hypothetical protein